MATGLSDLQSTAVSHCKGAQGVALTFPNGFKVSYSGDCRPSKSFAEIGKGSTVLIHEATFDDELRGDAKAKKHSTISEAIGVGKAMGARRLILTHFSQRYQKMLSMKGIESQVLELEEPTSDVDEVAIDLAMNLSNEVESTPIDIPINSLATNKSELEPKVETYKIPISSSQNDMKIGIAFDLMRVKVKDIMLLEKFAPAFKKLYEDRANQDAQSLHLDSDNEVSGWKQGKAASKEMKRKKKGLEQESDQAKGEPRTGDERSLPKVKRQDPIKILTGKVRGNGKEKERTRKAKEQG